MREQFKLVFIRGRVIIIIILFVRAGIVCEHEQYLGKAREHSVSE